VRSLTLTYPAEATAGGDNWGSWVAIIAASRELSGGEVVDFVVGKFVRAAVTGVVQVKDRLNILPLIGGVSVKGACCEGRYSGKDSSSC